MRKLYQHLSCPNSLYRKSHVPPPDNALSGSVLLAGSRRARAHCTVLCCTALYCTVLCCTALYYTILHSTALHCAVLNCAALCCTELYFNVLYCNVLYFISLHNISLHCTSINYTLSLCCNITFLHQTIYVYHSLLLNFCFYYCYCIAVLLFFTLSKISISLKRFAIQVFDKMFSLVFNFLLLFLCLSG